MRRCVECGKEIKAAAFAPGPRHLVPTGISQDEIPDGLSFFYYGYDPCGSVRPRKKLLAEIARAHKKNLKEKKRDDKLWEQAVERFGKQLGKGRNP